MSQVSGNVARVGGGPSGVEKKRKKWGKKKRQNSWLNSKMESALEVENPEKKQNTFVGSSSSIVASWASFKVFSLAAQIFH